MLKLKRYQQWIQVLRQANLSPIRWAKLLAIPFTEERATKTVWRHRISQCTRCPIFDKNQKKCLQCECYMPIKAMFAEQQCAGEIDGVLAARGWSESRESMSTLDIFTEAAIDRGRDGAEIIEKQKEEQE